MSGSKSDLDSTAIDQERDNPSASDPQLAISPQALLNYVRQMRISSNRRLPTCTSPSNPHQAPLKLPNHHHHRASSTTSSTEDDYSVIHSPKTTSQDQSDRKAGLTIPDTGQDSKQSTSLVPETLDLSHQRINDLTLSVVEELSEYVERLALGYNYLPVLPDHFSILGDSLRYLNLRGNHMEIFPEVLTRMPSLEILDVSRNKIKAFPRRPGTLDRLRVLSVSRNRIRRLPNYVSNLSTLRVLKLDHNPIIWPPREQVTFIDAMSSAEKPGGDEDELPESSQTREDMNKSTGRRTRTPSNESSALMAHWLRGLQDWMRKNPYVRPIKSVRPSTGDPSTWQKPNELLAVKSFSLPKPLNSTDYSPTALSSDTIQSPIPSMAKLSQPPPPFQSPEEPPPAPVLPPSSSSSSQHNRNASSSSSSQWVRKRPDLRLKKSLPDLRRNHGEIMVERRADADRSFSGLTRLHHNLNLNTPNTGSSASFGIKSPSPITYQDRAGISTPHSTAAVLQPSVLVPPDASSSAEGSASSSVHFTALDLLNHTRSPQVRRIKIETHTSEDRLAGDRNSGAYFRRLSMLPVSTISKEVPIPFLKLMDAIRGILFSLSQIYAALKQFVVFATQDRLPGALSRVMSAADDSMGRLINSLDRFDSSTRKSQPDGTVIKEVLVCCRDNVSVFGKLVNVLSIQLKVLTGSADVRYSRTLLLSLYGATAEIGMSWSAITPLVDDVVKLSKKKLDTVSSRAALTPIKKLEKVEPPASSHSEFEGHQALDPEKYFSKTEDSPLPSFQSPSSANFVSGLTRTTALSSSLSAAGNGNGSSSNRPKGRRHAGSFSVEDVQLGAILPPASAGLSSNFPGGSSPSSNLFPPLPSCNSLEINKLRDRSGSNRVGNGSMPSTALGLPLLTIGEKDAEPSEIGSPLPGLSPLRSLGSLRVHEPAVAAGSNGNGQDKEEEVEKPSALEQQQLRSLETQSSCSTPAMSDIHDRFMASSPDVVLDGGVGPFRYQKRGLNENDHLFSLSRTDQDFLDMTEATIKIAVSVCSMMLENLNQARIGGETIEPVRREDRSGQPNVGAAGGLAKVSKAAELKELCEITLEIIKKLRDSLNLFWALRVEHDHHHQRQNGSSLMSSSSGREFGGSGSAGGTDVGEGGDDGSHSSGRIKGYETRRVYEDATAFVKAVIQTANLARATMTEYRLSKAIREGLGELTKATKELATLLAVSSFKPTANGASTPGAAIGWALSSTVSATTTTSSSSLSGSANNNPMVNAPSAASINLDLGNTNENHT